MHQVSRKRLAMCPSPSSSQKQQTRNILRLCFMLSVFTIAWAEGTELKPASRIQRVMRRLAALRRRQNDPTFEDAMQPFIDVGLAVRITMKQYKRNIRPMVKNLKVPEGWDDQSNAKRRRGLMEDGFAYGAAGLTAVSTLAGAVATASGGVLIGTGAFVFVFLTGGGFGLAALYVTAKYHFLELQTEKGSERYMECIKMEFRDSKDCGDAAQFLDYVPKKTQDERAKQLDDVADVLESPGIEVDVEVAKVVDSKKSRKKKRREIARIQKKYKTIWDCDNCLMLYTPQ